MDKQGYPQIVTRCKALPHTMPRFAPNTSKLLHKIHRWGGLLIAAFILFYCITGLLLNHRQDLGFFQKQQRETKRVAVSDLSLLNSFISTYKKQIKRQDDPKVIRIKDGSTIEFLYGSHGKTTYVIHPRLGSMEIIKKSYLEPWHWLNNLHKAWKTNAIWLFISDVITILIGITTLTGIVMLRYRSLDILITSSGVIILLIGALFAW